MTNLLWPGDHRAGEHMTDRALLQSMVAVESAWLDALVAEKLAPPACAGADLPMLLTANDCESLAVAAEDGGNPVIGLAELLRQRALPAIGPWIHRGLTSQDVLDTALSNLREEVYKTEDYDYRQALKSREALLRSLLDRLAAPVV